MLRIKKISDVLNKKVYTDEGELFGEVEEVNLMHNKVDSWRIRVGGNASQLFNGARGVIIPHNFIKAVGDVFIVNQMAMPSQQEELPELEEGE